MDQKRFAGKTKTGVGSILLVLGLAVGASAATPALAQSTGETDVTVEVNSILTLTGLTSSFTITGDPSTTETSAGAATMTVLTNNLTGYVVSVQSAAASLAGATEGNADTIPIANLKVKDSAASSYTSLSADSALAVSSSSTKTDELGTTVTNDYQVDIPWVNNDTYSVTLDYVLAAQ